MELVRFEHKEYLWGLLILLPLILLWILAAIQKKRKLKSAGDIELLNKLFKDKFLPFERWKNLLVLLSIALLILSLANLQFGASMEKVKREGVDLVIALDVSNSMLAEDVVPNRLEKTKQLIYRLIDNLSNDRIGLIIFAGRAYVQMPLTIDYAAAKMFISNVSPSLVPTQGTAIGEAIQMAEQLFEQGEKKYKTLVIFSDGENHEGNAIEEARNSRKKGTIIHTIGVGTVKGAPIPVYRGNRIIDYRRDKNDQIILTRMNENMLQQIALEGGGKYFRLSSSENTIKELVKQIERQEKKEIDTRVVTDYNSKYQIFLGLALFFLCLEFILPLKKVSWLDWLNFNRKK